MFQVKFVPAWAIGLALCIGGASGRSQTVSSLDFAQVSYYQNQGLAVSNSAWGQFDVTYNQGSSLGWINIVENPGTANAAWIVQNEPLLPSMLTGTSQYTSTTYFNLGVSNGTPVSAVNIGYSITSAPAMSAPTSLLGTGNYTVGASQNIINSGVPSGNTALGAPSNGNLNWNVPFAGLSLNYHQGMPNVAQEENWCGPGAAANSLHWLNQTNNLGLNQTLLQSQTELAANMGNNHTGNWDDAEVQGKLKFIADHNLPLDVHYTGGTKLPTNGNYTGPNGNGVAVNDGKVTWDWIQSEMKKGEDVELMTGTHWVVVEAALSFNGINLLEYRDDPFQHGAATTAAEQDILDNRNVWTYFSDGFTNIGNGQETIQAAVSESVPEPSSVTLLIIGAAGTFLGALRARKARSVGPH